MANFKAPVASLFNGEQFELNGNVISGKGGLVIIDAVWNDGDPGYWTSPKTSTEIIAMIDAGTEVKIRFTDPEDSTRTHILDVDFIDRYTGYENVYFKGMYDLNNTWWDGSFDFDSSKAEPLASVYFYEARVSAGGDVSLFSSYLTSIEYNYTEGSIYLGDNTAEMIKAWQDIRPRWSYQPFITLSVYPGTASEPGDKIEDTYFYIQTGSPSGSSFDDETDIVLIGGLANQYKVYVEKPDDEADSPVCTIERLPAPGSFNIVLTYDTTEKKYACNHTLAEIVEAVGKELDINIKVIDAEGKVSYDQWGIDEIDADKVVFKNGYYRNDEDYERCWIEESIKLLAAYVKDAKTLELVEKVVYSRDYKIKYIANLPTGETLVGKVPAPKFASEADEDGEYKGNFAFIAEDFVDPTCTVEGLEFGGWFKDAAGTEQYAVGDAITKDIKLYAKWAAAATPVTISLFTGAEGANVFEETFDHDFMSGSTLDLHKSIPASSDIVSLLNIGAGRASQSLGTVDSIMDITVNGNPYDDMLTIDDTISDIVIYVHTVG